MEMQVKLERPSFEPTGQPTGATNRFLANRQLWKNAIYGLAFVTYLCSFLFFGLAVADVRANGGPSSASLFDLMVALYFLVQVIFLFVLSGVVERRRQSQPIDFPDRRDRS